MKRYFHNFKFAMFGVSILCIALGLGILLWPEYAKKVMCYGFGAVLILSGVLQVASYITGERVGLLRKILLISGIVAAVAGVWVLFTPGMVETLTMIVLGIVLIYHGVMDVKYGFDIKACGTKGWAPALVFGLLTCGAGVLLLVNPFEKPESLFLAAGLGFLFDGLTDMFTVFTVAHAKTVYDRLESSAPVIELEPGQAQTVPVTGNTVETPAVPAPAEGETAELEADTEAAEPVPADEG